MASAFLANPENRDQHIQRASASTIMSITYDYPTLASGQDKAVQDMDRLIHEVTRAVIGTFLVESFPWMRHVPLRLTVSSQLQYDTHI